MSNDSFQQRCRIFSLGGRNTEKKDPCVFWLLKTPLSQVNTHWSSACSLLWARVGWAEAFCIPYLSSVTTLLSWSLRVCNHFPSIRTGKSWSFQGADQVHPLARRGHEDPVSKLQARNIPRDGFYFKPSIHVTETGLHADGFLSPGAPKDIFCVYSQRLSHSSDARRVTKFHQGSVQPAHSPFSSDTFISIEREGYQKAECSLALSEPSVHEGCGLLSEDPHRSGFLLGKDISCLPPLSGLGPGKAWLLAFFTENAQRLI